MNTEGLIRSPGLELGQQERRVADTGDGYSRLANEFIAMKGLIKNGLIIGSNKKIGERDILDRHHACDSVTKMERIKDTNPALIR